MKMERQDVIIELDTLINLVFTNKGKIVNATALNSSHVNDALRDWIDKKIDLCYFPEDKQTINP